MRRIPQIAICVILLASRASGDDGILPIDHAALVADLIEQLASPSFQQREAASEQLEFIGETALPKLRKAAIRNDDAELRWRARRLTHSIMHNACISKSTGMPLIYLRGSKFQMGSNKKEAGRKDDELRHTVEITQPYLLGKFEVTQAEYRRVMKATPSEFLPKDNLAEKMFEVYQSHPVDSVSWFDACAFCNQLSDRDGLPAYYRIEEIEKPKGSIRSAEVSILGGTGYRLPTEAEWEYACRAGSAEAYGAVERRTSTYGNYKHRVATSYGTSARTASKKSTVPVGGYSANLFGFHDLHGNVAEWCGDWYDKSFYGQSPAKNPTGPSTGDHRVIRGGSWLVSEANCRSAARFWHPPDEGKYFIGFRVARTASEYMTAQPESP